MQAAAPGGVLFHGVRRVQRLPVTGEVSLSRMQLMSQSVPDQPAAGELGRPQDVPRVRARSLALQMHGLQRVQTSQGIQPLAERPRNGFPHPLQDLRDVRRVQASLLRPSVQCPRHEAVYEMRRSGKSPGVLHMQQDTGQETLPRVSMEVGIKYEGIPQLVPAMHRMPQMHQMRRG